MTAMLRRGVTSRQLCTQLSSCTLSSAAPIASTSTSSASAISPAVPASARTFSSSSIQQESKARRKTRLTRKAAIEKKAEAIRQHALSAPDPILGYAKGNEQLYEKSLLASVLLKREEIWGDTIKVVAGESAAKVTAIHPKREGNSNSDEKEFSPNSSAATSTTADDGLPKHFNFGLSRQQAEELTSSLPAVASLRTMLGSSAPLNQTVQAARIEKAYELEEGKREKLLRIMDLRLSGSQGIEVENRRRIVQAFGDTETDTGKPEVQAAILTAKIHSLKNHLVAQPRDVHNRRPLRALVQQRAKILKYLRAVDVRRYEEVLPKLGVEPRAIEGEIIVTKLGLRNLIRPQ